MATSNILNTTTNQEMDIDMQNTKATKDERKRARISTDPEASPQNNQDSSNTEVRDLTVTDNFPRFLVMETVDTDKTFNDVSCFVIEKAMKGVCDLKSMKKLRSGALLLETCRPAQS